MVLFLIHQTGKGRKQLNAIEWISLGWNNVSGKTVTRLGSDLPQEQSFFCTDYLSLLQKNFPERVEKLNEKASFIHLWVEMERIH